jgi:hypothetical protein
MATTMRPKLNTVDFERIETVRYEARELIVCFRDGHCARIPIDLLRDYDVSDDEWSTVIAEEHHIRVPTNHGEVDIPWDVLRYLSDATFHEEWDVAMDNANRIAGARLRTLREQRGLSVSQLSKRIGEDEAIIRGIEDGTSAQPQLEARILAAMGYTYSDLATVQ